MRVLVDQRPVDLGREHFVASGGEGTVYARDGVAYKIFFDTAQVPDATRIAELSRITDPQVIRPARAIHSPSGQMVGHTMRFLADHLPLCRLFTRSFRESARVDAHAIRRLVHRLAESLQAIHAAGVAVVDMNPMNVLVSPDLRDPYWIDTSSWQTPSRPATAVFDAVRDRHTSDFGPESDWFSFAVITFQAFIGIHPYRGKHPTVSGLDARMRANLTVLDPSVSRPSICYPLRDLPPSWRSWYERVLVHGERIAPPSTPTELPTGALRGPVPAIGCSPRAGKRVLAEVIDGRLVLTHLADGQVLPLSLTAREATAFADQITVRTRDKLVRIHLHDVGSKVIASPTVLADVLPHATRLYPGVAILDLLGRTWALLPRPGGGCDRVRLPALDGIRILEAERTPDGLAITTFGDAGLRRTLYPAH